MIKINFNSLYLTKKYDYNTENIVSDVNLLYKTAFDRLKLKNQFSVNISFVGQNKIKMLNKLYRGVDRVTDVLSFPLISDYNNLQQEEDENGNIDLGDIVINLKRAQMQANEYNHSFKREICFLCLHGLLHLLGYDHIKKEDENVMFPLQEEILNMADIRR